MSSHRREIVNAKNIHGKLANYKTFIESCTPKYSNQPH